MVENLASILLSDEVVLRRDYEFRTGYTLTSEQAELIDELEVKIQDMQKKELIGNYAERFRAVGDVVQGRSSFLKMGVPILRRSEVLESTLAKVAGNRISTKDIVGVGQSGEATRHLKHQNVINPDCYFQSNIKTVSERFAPFARWFRDSNHRGLVGVGLIAASEVMGALAGATYDLIFSQDGYAAMRLGCAVGFIGGACLYPKILLGPRLYAPSEAQVKLAEDRNKFKSALEKMDSEVRRFYPL